MALNLITTLDNNFVKDFPSQNTVNCNLIDAYAGPYAVQTYTPAFTGLTSNPSIGSTGVLRGFYYTLFDQVYTWGEFKFNGTGSNKGSGTYSISLPFNVKSSIAPSGVPGAGPILGNAVAIRASVATDRQPMVAQLRTVNTIVFAIHINSGVTLSRFANGDDVPFAWANTDGIKWNVRYQRDSA